MICIIKCEGIESCLCYRTNFVIISNGTFLNICIAIKCLRLNMKHYEIYLVGIISFPIEVYKEKSIEPQKKRTCQTH